MFLHFLHSDLDSRDLRASLMPTPYNTRLIRPHARRPIDCDRDGATIRLSISDERWVRWPRCWINVTKHLFCRYVLTSVRLYYLYYPKTRPACRPAIWFIRRSFLAWQKADKNYFDSCWGTLVQRIHEHTCTCKYASHMPTADPCH